MPIKIYSYEETPWEEDGAEYPKNDLGHMTKMSERPVCDYTFDEASIESHEIKLAMEHW